MAFRNLSATSVDCNGLADGRRSIGAVKSTRLEKL